ncbi:TPA: type II secretion system minor pseudopilin GspJ [Escherichia fergusonii]|nr:type II secretion system protein GspJ [Escherichia fergusonii]HAI1314647.1 type II secretion system minor pseudopilin GspJ [Escherichia fergusonii]
MALFYYQALQRNGRKTKGMIEADSARHARQLLRGKELIPVHIEARMNASAGGMLQRRRHAHRRVAAADLALFTRQLATLVQAAMPLETCLQAVSEQSEKLHVKSLGMALRSRIQEGYTLSDSLREHPRVFDSLFCSMVAAGEKSGHLDVVLNRLADYTEQRQRLKSRLLQAILYPLVLLVVATGVVTILLTAVVPKIIEQFDHLGHALPASTRALIAMSDVLQTSGVYWLAGLLGLLVRGDQGQREPALLAGAGVLASESEGIRFVRGGVVNPLMRLPRSNLLTVGYRIHDGYLERLAWPLTDAAGSVKPTTQKLIPADSLRLQFYDGTRWQDSWSSVQAIPVAVRMTLHSPQWGEIERIWLLRGPQLS